jgi:bacteriocin biosynthesis cyclodehydratase domain-containing protein
MLCPGTGWVAAPRSVDGVGRMGGVPAERPAAGTAWRPRLVTGLRPVWRDGGSVQFGVDPTRAVVVESVTEGWMRLLLELDGRRDDAEVVAAAGAAGLDPVTAERLLAELRAAGVLADATPPPAPVPAGVTPLPLPRSGAAQRAAAAARLAADRAALALLAGDLAGAYAGVDRAGSDPAAAEPPAGEPPAGDPPGGPHRGGGWPAGGQAGGGQPGGRHPDVVLSRRRHTAVVVYGAGRVGVPLAALLGAAGIGHVHLVDRGWVRPVDLAPGGAVATDLHRRRDEAGAAAVRRVAPETRTAELPVHRPADLVVLTGDRCLDTDLVDALHAGGTPHLAVSVRETTAIVGPLVLPGRTGCLRCADLHRTDRDPAWPLLAAQLSGPRPPLAIEPCEVTLAALAAALGAAQVLGHVAGEPPAALGTLGGTLELAAPGWRIRRRGWPPHPACGCGAADADPGRPARAASVAGPDQGQWVV